VLNINKRRERKGEKEALNGKKARRTIKEDKSTGSFIGNEKLSVPEGLEN